MLLNTRDSAAENKFDLGCIFFLLCRQKHQAKDHILKSGLEMSMVTKKISPPKGISNHPVLIPLRVFCFPFPLTVVREKLALGNVNIKHYLYSHLYHCAFLF